MSIVCGLRPVRSTVRFEVECIAPDRLLIHNHGHGGTQSLFHGVALLKL